MDVDQGGVIAPGAAADLPSSDPQYAACAGQFDPCKDLLDQALRLYGVRALDNVDLSRAPLPSARLRIVGRALMERGDARAFVLGRKLLSAAG